jgi:hypothetical protein
MLLLVNLCCYSQCYAATAAVAVAAHYDDAALLLILSAGMVTTVSQT